MAIIQISKIQFRRGRLEDIKNIQLGISEPCHATDTRQLFIGNGSVSEGAVTEGMTEVLTEFSTIDFTNLVNVPTTLAGYGISDTSNIIANTANKLTTPITIAKVSFDGSSNIDIPFSNLINIPSTVAGYGIIDISTSANKLSTPVKIAKTLFDGSSDIDISFTNLIDIPSTITGYGIVDATDIIVKKAEKLNTAVNIAKVSFDGFSNIDIPFQNLTNIPSTVIGYGIIDVADVVVKKSEKLNTAVNIAKVSFDGSVDIDIPFQNLTNIPSTVMGYGITDVNKVVVDLSNTTNQLSTAVNIANVPFDGSSNIDIPFSNLINIPTTIVGYGIVDGLSSNITKSTEKVIDLGLATDGSTTIIDISTSNVFVLEISGTNVTITITGQPPNNESNTIILYITNTFATGITFTSTGNFVWSGGSSTQILAGIDKYCYKFQWIHTTNINDIFSSCLYNG